MCILINIENSGNFYQGHRIETVVSKLHINVYVGIYTSTQTISIPSAFVFAGEVDEKTLSVDREGGYPVVKIPIVSVRRRVYHSLIKLFTVLP